MRSEIGKNKAQVEEIANSIKQKWEQLNQGQQQINIAKFKAEMEANYPSMMEVIGRAIDDTFDLIGSVGGGRTQYKKTKK